MTLVDLAYTHDELKDRMITSPCPISDSPKYPWGLQISLDNKTLEKLNCDFSDWKVGDVIPLDIIAKVTSVSANETEGGTECSVSLQITHLGGEEQDAALEQEDDLVPHGYKRIRT